MSAQERQCYQLCGYHLAKVAAGMGSVDAINDILYWRNYEGSSDPRSDLIRGKRRLPPELTWDAAFQ